MSKAARTKQLIIDKSAILFNTKGVAGTSLSDILDATKLAKGSLYVHFENKDAIAHAVVDYFADRQLKLLEASLSGTQSAQARLFAYLDVFLNAENPPFEGGCPFLNLGMEADDTDELARKKIKKVIDITHIRIANTVEAGISSGEFSPDWIAEEFAAKAYAMIEGAMMVRKITGNAQSMELISNVLKKEISMHTL